MPSQRSLHVALTSSANPASLGSPVVFTAYVSSPSGIPIGSVTFYSGATTLGSDTLDENGYASFATSALASGSHAISVGYGGSALHTASSSSTLTQAVQTAQQTWLSSHFTPAQMADPSISGLGADFDHDGIPTLLEYALGSHPQHHDLNALPTALRLPQGQLALTFYRARTDVTYVVEASYDLVTWTPLSTPIIGSGQYQTITDTAPANSTKRFIRLSVSN
jgi:hypothetical protein